MDAAHSDLRIDRENDGSRPLRMWSVCFAVVGAFVIFCYLWIDRPLAFWLYTHQHHFPDTDDLNALARIPNPLIILSTILFLVLGFMKLAGRPLGRFLHVVLVSSASVLVG